MMPEVTEETRLQPQMPPSRKYNISYLIDGLGMGGAERLLVPILRNLSRDHFNPRVCVFQVKGGNPIEAEIQALGVPIDHIPVRRLRDLSALPRLYKYLKSVRADLVHTQLEFADSLGGFTAKLLRLPTVSTQHVLPPQDMNFKDKLHRKLELFSLRHFCDLVISVSEEARRRHLQASNADPQTVRTLYNGIDLNHAVNLDAGRERSAVRRELGIPPDAPVLTTVAVLREEKGIQFMLRALPTILRTHPGARYLIAGDGTYADQLRQEAADAGVTQNVIFAGMRKDVPRILAASDIFVLPSLTEALPTVLAEAMACRLPIVASSVGGVPEMIEDGRSGTIVSPGNLEELAASCIRLLDDPDLQKKMGLEGWRIVNEKFTVNTQVEQLKDIYLTLIGKYER